MADINGVEVKSEPVDPLVVESTPTDPTIIPKEFLVSGTTFQEESDCEDLLFFTQVEVDNTRKCLENTRLIIKDFETQLDWHLQQYITLRNIFNNKKTDGSKRQDLLSISQLSAIIANHPEGNKKFIKRKGPISNGGGGRKKKKGNSESEEDSEDSEDSEEFDEEDSDSENEDDPTPRKKKGKKGDADLLVKDEIEEEYNELVVPKEELESEEEEEEEDEDDDDEDDVPLKARGKKPAAKAPPKAPPKKAAPKGKKKAEPAKKGGKRKPAATKVQRMDEESNTSSIIEIKDELDKEEMNEMLQSKLIFDLDEFDIDEEKPIVILKHDNVKDFDFSDLKTSNVVITFDDCDQLPEFMFAKDVAKNILNGNIKAVEVGVFDMYNDAKN